MAGRVGGIAGFWGRPGRGLLESMAAALLSPESGACARFERAPMSLACRAFPADRGVTRGQGPPGGDATLHCACVYEGELGNYHALREQLAGRGHVLHTDSDAELVLSAYLEYGAGCFELFDGTWTVAIADLRGGRPALVLGRDRFGTRPLYYASAGDRLLFASRIASILQHPSLRATPDDRRLDEYLRGERPADDAATFFAGVRRLRAAYYAVVDHSGYAEHAYATPPRILDSDPEREERIRRVREAVEADAATAHAGSVEFMAEVAQVIWHNEEPLTGVDSYLRWRTPRLAGTPDPDMTNPASSVPGTAALELRWLRARRAQVQGIFRSPSFCSRPYWDGPAVADAFSAACAHHRADPELFWRTLNAELWLRVFVDRPARWLRQPPLGDGLEEQGEGRCRTLDVRGVRPNRGCHLAMVGRDGSPYLRLPVRTQAVGPGDPLEAVIREGVTRCPVALRPGDVLVIAEKVVAISQGRCYPAAEVSVRPLARLLSRFAGRTPAGISLRLPASLQLAMDDVGVTRILAATAAAALTRPLGMHGAFYRVAGWQVAAIDSPDPDALPPSDTHVKLAPLDPEGTAEGLADRLSAWAGVRVEVAVIDANDIGAEILGASRGADRGLLVSLLRDNPLGQDIQQTPVGIVRRAVPSPALSPAEAGTARHTAGAGITRRSRGDVA